MKKYILFKDKFGNILMADIKEMKSINSHFIYFTKTKEIVEHTQVYFGNFIKLIQLSAFQRKHRVPNSWVYESNGDNTGYTLVDNNDKVEYINIVLDNKKPEFIYEFEDDEIAELFAETIKGENYD